MVSLVTQMLAVAERSVALNNKKEREIRCPFFQYLALDVAQLGVHWSVSEK